MMPVHNLTQGFDYGTIQAAIDAANPGDTIECDPGTYNENVLINKNNLILRSTSGKAVTTIQGTIGGGNGSVMVAGGTNGVKIGETAKGFTIIGYDGNGSIEAAALYLLDLIQTLLLKAIQLKPMENMVYWLTMMQQSIASP
ncbi:MAG: hypothetical protein IPP06_06245 [Saprospiraceae bacterium]|nr:hypothetical protein [Candidatus Vicinibacter affinis]